MDSTAGDALLCGKEKSITISHSQSIQNSHQPLTPMTDFAANSNSANSSPFQIWKLCSRLSMIVI